MNNLFQEALEFVYNRNPNGGKIIFLGDYIDRGLDTIGVLETLMNPPADWEFICLSGNHEEMFLDNHMSKYPLGYFDLDDANKILTHPKKEEIFQWLKDLKLFHIEDENVFAHAFYNDRVYPENQISAEVLWYRMSDSETYDNTHQGYFLTHGHTPRKNGPILSPNRVNLDVGIYSNNRLVIGEYKKDVRGPINFYEFTTFKNL
jgi:serine/threonine protein phosphatase 1